MRKFLLLGASAIIAGAVVIALAILISNHWQFAISSSGYGVALRLNRWTGTISICVVDPNAAKDVSLTGAQLACNPPDEATSSGRVEPKR